MVYLLIGISAHLAFWLLRSRMGVLYRLAADGVCLVDGMLQGGDEDEQLDALERRTSQVLGSFLLFLTWVMLAVGVAASLPWTWSWWRGAADPWGAFATWPGILALSVGGTLGVFYPKGRQSPSAYSPLNQLLHRLALDNPNLHRRLHDREVKQWRKSGGVPEKRFVIVTGLARAGTTSLMQRLLETGTFSSLHYGNMPFVMAPRTWGRVHKPKATALKERSHGDGIMVGATSAEALEEPFFKMLTDGGYIGGGALSPHEVDQEMHAAYLDYQGLVRAPGKTYLAKNNNALLRYSGLRQHNSEFFVVMMFRAPLAHAASLRAMQRRYVAMQQADPFIQTYMDWLVHHEFGLGHKPFAFEGDGAQGGDPDGLDYWLDRWTAYYQHALSVDGHRVLWVPHETWSARPKAVLDKVMQTVALDGDLPEMAPHTRSRTVEEEVDPQRLAKAETLYGRLMERALHLD